MLALQISGRLYELIVFDLKRVVIALQICQRLRGLFTMLLRLRPLLTPLFGLH